MHTTDTLPTHTPLTLDKAATPSELQSATTIYIQPVAWGDMDSFNHVNNVAYYRYAESARIAYLYDLQMFKDETLTILAASSCNYLRPVHFPDTLLIGVRCANIGNTSLTMSYDFYSLAQKSVVAQGQATIVRTDMNGKKQSWSDAERAKILANS